MDTRDPEPREAMTPALHPFSPWLLPSVLAYTLLGGCTSSSVAPCFDDRACPGSRCVDGTCLALEEGADADWSLGDGAIRPDSRPSPDAVPDSAPLDAADARPPLDAGPPPDAGGPCEPDAVRYARCPDGRVHVEQCVDGLFEAGPCRAIPRAPCGWVCTGCNPELFGDGVDRREAFAPMDAHPRTLWPIRPQAWDRLCAGCNASQTGVPDYVCDGEADEEGRLTVERCQYCGQGQHQRRTFTHGEGIIDIVTRCGEREPSAEQARLRPDGRLDRYTLSDGRTLVARYDDGDLLATVDLIQVDGMQEPVWTHERALDGRIVRSFGSGGQVVTYDYGCWQCDDARCLLGSPAGCEVVSGLVPETFVCRADTFGCPHGLEPAWFSTDAEAIWAWWWSRDILELATAPLVGVERVDGELRWTADGRPVPPELADPDVGLDARFCICIGQETGAASFVGGHRYSETPRLADCICESDSRFTLCRRPVID